jgi:3-hydroxyacyl-[acyl-carrier-protein] dehydratase
MGPTMRFHLIDRIAEVVPGKSLRAIKRLTLAEEYLADHFPTFPIMPGVLQLQAIVEAGSWLLRLTDNYAQSVWVLREARNVKYGNLVLPGRAMTLSVELTKRDADTATFRGKAEVDGQSAVSAQVTLAGYNLRDRNPGWAERDEQIVRQLRAHGELLTPRQG